MRRIGKYTKKNNIRSARFATNKYVLWFKNLKWWQKTALILGPILAILVIIPLITYAYFARDIADKERLMNRNNTGVVLFDKNGEVIYQRGRAKHRDIVPLAEISPHLKQALLASEDKNFYNHSGISLTSMLGALYANITTGGKNFGGSTLTQQLAKNTLLTNQKSYLRKYQELSVAIAIERTYSKNEILEMYLNSVYYGENAFGIGDAAQVYFQKKPADLTLAESAMLIGVLPAPTSYSPISGNKEFAKQRQSTVLGRMVDNGMITAQQKQEALAAQLVYAPQKSPQDESPAPHFVEMVMAELYDTHGEEKVARSGFQVTTSLDLGMQRELQQIIAKQMPAIRAQGGSNAGAVVMDPKTGAVRALVGSYDWNDSAFGKVNMTTARRQPGSSFKPIYYAEALAQGVINPATILEDAPTDFNGYKPKNALRNFNGDVTARQALSWSLNIPAVKVMQRLGVGKSVDAAKRMGVTTMTQAKDYGLSLALGAAEAKLIDMTHVYAGFANGGNQYERRLVESIKSKFDKAVSSSAPKANRVISEEGAYLISHILSDNAARARIFGGSLNVYGKKVAVKTGTTDEQRDAWTIGYTPDLVVGVWVGNNDNTPMKSGGGTLAGPIWRAVMQKFAAKQSGDVFVRPAGVVERDACRGKSAIAARAGENTYKEVFLSTALPPIGCTAEQKEEERPSEDENKESDTAPQEPSTNQPRQTTPANPGASTGTNDDESNTGTVTPGQNPTPSPGGTAPPQPPTRPQNPSNPSPTNPGDN